MAPGLSPVDTAGGASGDSIGMHAPWQRAARAAGDSGSWSPARNADSAVVTGGPVEPQQHTSHSRRQRSTYSVSVGNVGAGGGSSGRLSDAQGSSPGGASDVSLAQLQHSSVGEAEPPLSDSAQARRPSQAYSGLQPPNPKDHHVNIVRPWQHPAPPLSATQRTLAGTPQPLSLIHI